MKKTEKESLETRAKKRNKKANIQNIVLGAVATVGIMGIATIAPNVLLAMKKLGLLPHKRQRESIMVSKQNLIKKGFLKLHNDKLEITSKGRMYLARHTFYKDNKKENKKWDGKWRVLIFDIPEKFRFIRNEIRMTLVVIGFMRLQDSVWIYPYDCENLIALLKADLEIGKDVLYMIVEELENDEEVKSYFGLDKNKS